MAPAALLCSSGTVQSLCQSTQRSSKVWQAKRSVSSGSASTRPSSDSKMEGGSVKSCLPVSVYESRRNIAVRHIARSVSSRHVFTAAVEGNVVVEEPSTDSQVAESLEEKTPETAAVAEEASAPAAAPAKKVNKFRPRGNTRAKREEPTVPVEALITGAVFTGKVTTIQSFGAFVNFGAFTDGLVHISKLSSGYVSNVADIVSVGQEVQVTVIDVDNNAGRIALSMAEKELKKEGFGRQSGEPGSEKSRLQEGTGGRPVNKGKSAGKGNQSGRRDDPKKPQTKLVKGQIVEGTVKNSVRGGVYVILPEEEEGFLKYSEIPGGENMAPEAGLQPGQKVTATVLRVDRGKITLSMKPVVDIKSVNSSINKGAGGGATNPFEIAFRSMDLFPEAAPVNSETIPDETLTPTEVEAEEASPAVVAEEVTEDVDESTTSFDEIAVEEGPFAEVEESTSAALTETSEDTPEEVAEVVADESIPEPVVEDSAPAAVVAQEAISEEAAVEEVPAESAPQEFVEEKVEVTESPTAEVTPDSVAEEAEGLTKIPTAEVAIPEPVEEKAEEVTDAPIAENATPESVEEKVEGLTEVPTGEVATPEPVEENAGEVTEIPAAEVVSSEAVHVEDKVKEVTEVPVAEAPAEVAAPEVKKAPAGISAAVVKQLRDETGAGMMDCKKALAESDGNLEKARDMLRKKGLANADKKASRIASEGLVASYVHDSRIGILIEVNCETDFVARGAAFKQLVSDLAMQAVASQQAKYVSVEDIPEEAVRKETELEMGREDLANKPEAVRAKIVEGRVSKRLNESVLLEQPYIRDDSILVKDLIKQTVATLGENIKVRRFQRYVLGEGLEKKSGDFAAEVAAQTAAKPAENSKGEEKSGKVQSAAQAEPAAPAVAVSAALVKELRELTGAGMMDSKKALVASNNDLEKAAEYLRKKGLASADKKASRLASEGLIGTYIHNGAIGVMVEVNCETDFVARSERFKDLVKDVAMQIAACPIVEYVSTDGVPGAQVEAERAIELGKEDLANKPEAVRAKIVEGRMAKRINELALLEQPFIKDDTKLVKDLVKETVIAVGENIQIRRFSRFNLGEGLEKKVVDFAAEVAAQTGQKS